jgi:hypothetical protein
MALQQLCVRCTAASAKAVSWAATTPDAAKQPEWPPPRAKSSKSDAKPSDRGKRTCSYLTVKGDSRNPPFEGRSLRVWPSLSLPLSLSLVLRVGVFCSVHRAPVPAAQPQRQPARRPHVARRRRRSAEHKVGAGPGGHREEDWVDAVRGAAAAPIVERPTAVWPGARAAANADGYNCAAATARANKNKKTRTPTSDQHASTVNRWRADPKIKKKETTTKTRWLTKHGCTLSFSRFLQPLG